METTYISSIKLKIYFNLDLLSHSETKSANAKVMYDSKRHKKRSSNTCLSRRNSCVKENSIEKSSCFCAELRATHYGDEHDNPVRHDGFLAI